MSTRRKSINTAALRHQKFVGQLLLGKTPADAYIAAGYKPRNRKVAHSAGNRLLHKVEVQERIAAMQKLLVDTDVLGLLDKRRFLKRVVMTPAAHVEADDPVCGKMTRTTRVTKDGTVEKVVVQIPDKLKALELDAKLAGELQGGVVQESGEGMFNVPSDMDCRMAMVLGGMRQVGSDAMEVVARTRTRSGAAEPKVVDPILERSLKLAEAMAERAGLRRTWVT